MEWSKANKQSRSYEQGGISLLALRPLFTAKILSDIIPWLIENYKKERKDKGESNQTANLDVACLKAMFSKAIIWGKVGGNPVKQVKMLKVNNTRVRFLDEDEVARLLAECQAHLRDLVVTALHMGFRRNELLSLRPEDVYLSRGPVSVRAGYAKNEVGRMVPITETLRTVLLRLV